MNQCRPSQDDLLCLESHGVLKLMLYDLQRATTRVSDDASFMKGRPGPSPACTTFLPGKAGREESRLLLLYCFSHRHSNRHAHLLMEMSATCVQRLNDSRSPAIHTRYRSWLRSSSLREPRYPPLRVVSFVIVWRRSSHKLLTGETVASG